MPIQDIRIALEALRDVSDEILALMSEESNIRSFERDTFEAYVKDAVIAALYFLDLLKRRPAGVRGDD